MEYLVLARKWRPQAFADVLGQEHVVRTLANAISQERIAHAFLFSGPRGVGKTSIARILAKALNCEQGPTPTPCNVCSHCREITDGIAIDVREIDGASNRGIDEIRELRENVKFAPVSCRFKVYIIDEVHMLTREAFNALLKTLEEPPAHVIFIFATTETHKVPATILSRCQCFEFRRIPLKLIAESLRKIAGAEGISISDAGLMWIAEAGDGSLRDSQSIFDQVISYAGFAIEDRAVEEILGRSDRRFLFSLSEAVLSRDPGSCLKTIDDAYYAGLDMKYFYQTLLGHFRNLLLVGIAGGEGALSDLAADEIAKLRAQAAGVPQETLQRLLEILMTDEENVRRSQNARLNLEAILCRMAYLEPLIPIEQVLARMEGIERRLGNGPPPAPGVPTGSGQTGGRPVPTAAPNRQPPAGPVRGQTSGQVSPPEPQPGNRAESPYPGPPPQSQERLLESRSPYAPRGGEADKPGGWNEFKEFIKRQDAALCAKIESGQCLACGEGGLRLGFAKGYLFLDDVEAGRAAIESLAARFFGRSTALAIETLTTENGQANGAANGNGATARAKTLRLQEIRREALSHPLVQKIIDVFPGAEVKDIRPREAAPQATAAATPLPDEAYQPPTEGESEPVADEPDDD